MGGCQSAKQLDKASTAVTPEKPTRSDVCDVEATKTQDVTENNYVGFYENLNLLCLDQFVSRYTGEIMHRWRPATIVYVENDSVKVHFDGEYMSYLFVVFFSFICQRVGWKEKHDIWLNLRVDLKRFCFIEMLDENQTKHGDALSADQLAQMVIYAKTGVSKEHSTVTSPERDPFYAKKEYYVGQKVDIQDEYKSKGGSGENWRPGEITEVQKNRKHVLVHYIGWSNEWDEVVDTTVDGHRIKEGGSKIVPRGTSRDPFKRQVVAASPTLKKKQIQKQQRFREQGKEQRQRGGEGRDATRPQATRRRSLGEKGISESGGLDSLVNEELNRKHQQRQKSGEAMLQESQTYAEEGRRNYQPNIGSERDSRKIRRGLSRNLSFPPLSYDEESNNEEYMFHLYEQQEKEYYADLQKEKDFVSCLNDQKMHVVEVDGDGNCLFRAVAHQIWLDEGRHLELRRMCVSHMKRHKDRFAVFFEGDFSDHLEAMSKPGKWGDDLEIKAMEEITDRLIYIYCSQSPVVEPLKTNFDEVSLLQGVSPLKISYHGKNHYNSIFDETTCLPLAVRGSNTLSSTRHKHLMGDG